jgi:hypothetical protein
VDSDETRSVGECVEDGADVHRERGGDEADEPRSGLGGGTVGGASQRAEPDLHHHHHGHHEEDASDDGADGGGEHAEADVDVGAQRVVRVLGVDEVERQLEPLRHQAGEEEGGEGHHLQHQQRPRHARPRVAGRVARQGQPHEHGHREERVHVHHAVQSRHVHARRVRRQRRRELPLEPAGVVRAVPVLLRSGGVRGNSGLVR